MKLFFALTLSSFFIFTSACKDLEVKEDVQAEYKAFISKSEKPKE